MTSILKPWVTELGLRHQGVLVSAIRGCDGVPKDDPSKALVRCLRCEILVPFCERPSSFIDDVSSTELLARMDAVAKSFDHYPVHFLLHLMHAAEIIGYKHRKGFQWASFYRVICKKLHVNPETEEQLDHRLNADEKTFAKQAGTNLSMQNVPKSDLLVVVPGGMKVIQGDVQDNIASFAEHEVGSGFYEGHQIKELDDQAAGNYRGVRS